MAVELFKTLWTFVQGLWANHILLLVAVGGLGLVLGAFLISSIVRFLVMPFINSPSVATNSDISFSQERKRGSPRTELISTSSEKGLRV